MLNQSVDHPSRDYYARCLGLLARSFPPAHNPEVYLKTMTAHVALRHPSRAVFETACDELVGTFKEATPCIAHLISLLDKHEKLQEGARQ
jgi:hypothetical protein